MFDWDLPSYCSLAATHNPMELKLRMRNAVFQAFLGVRLRVSLRNSLCCEQLETLLTLILRDKPETDMREIAVLRFLCIGCCERSEQ